MSPSRPVVCEPLHLHGPLPDGALRLERLGLTLELPEPDLGPGVPLAPEGPRVMSRGRVKARGGAAEQLEIQALGAGRRGFRWVIELASDGSGVAAQLVLENRGPEPWRIPALRPMRVATGPAALRAPTPPLPGLGFARGRTALLLGCLAPGAGEPRFTSASDELAVEEPGHVIAPGEVAASGRYWLGWATSPEAAEAAAVDRTAAELQADPPGRGAVHWPGERRWRHLAAVELAPVGPPRGEAWRVGSGPAPFTALPRADAWEAPDPLAWAAVGARWFQLAVAFDPAAGGPDELRAAASLAALAGGLTRLPHPPHDLPPARAEILTRTLPPLGRPARRAGPGALVVPLLGERVAVGLWQTGAASEAPAPELADLGVAGPAHAFDFWAGRALGVVRERIPPVALPPGGCRVIGLTPLAERAQVVGTTLHVGMGTLEVAALREGAGGRVLVLRHPGRHRGRVFVAEAGEGEVRAVDVAFEDACEVAVPG